MLWDLSNYTGEHNVIINPQEPEIKTAKKQEPSYNKSHLSLESFLLSGCTGSSSSHCSLTLLGNASVIISAQSVIFHNALGEKSHLPTSPLEGERDKSCEPKQSSVVSLISCDWRAGMGKQTQVTPRSMCSVRAVCRSVCEWERRTKQTGYKLNPFQL